MGIAMNKSALTVLVSRFSTSATGVTAFKVWSTIRDLPVWTRFDQFNIRTTGRHRVFLDYDCASVGDELYVCGFNGPVFGMGMVWPEFTVRSADGTWQPWTAMGEDFPSG